MKELLEQAAQFLKDHPEINEVEVTDAFHNTVRLVRFTPMSVTYAGNWTDAAQWKWK